MTTNNAQPMTANTSISSSKHSPETIEGQLLNEAVRRASLQSSPVNLTSNLSNLSMSGAGPLSGMPPMVEQLQPEVATYTIKVKNAPSDITLREAYCIFALARDLIGLELLPDSNNLPIILAKFKTLAAASTYSQVLESNQVFGPAYPFYLKAEITDTNFQPSMNLGASSKRPSIGNHRSRFLFSDPFSNEAITEEASNSGNGAGAGKSLLLMESQQDAREYEQLVRDPWGQPHPPSRSQPGSSVSLNASAVGAPGSGYGPSQPQTPSVEWDRRRQGSAFFTGQSPLLNTQMSSQIPSQLSLNQNGMQLPPSSQPLAPIMNQHNNMPMPPQSAPASQQTQSSSQQSLAQSSQASSQGPPAQSSASQQQQFPSASSPSDQSSQVDLSLLARVPPPANPADQNPPCNTLYVGNLPPDATEAELRQLFSPQRGFRRLSFRTKQANSSTSGVAANHAHGPMCFVEFEDIAYATRALAELYGRTLPRPGGVPGKGGIRLSFSKNPLGVRGPGQRRSSAFNYQPGPAPGFKS